MTMKLTKDAYLDLIAGNVAWLEQQPDTLERRHIQQILEVSARHEYDDQDRIATLERQLNEASERVLHEMARASEAEARAAKLEKFKTFVHERLDAAGVPADPEPEANAQHGCRIEGRLNWLECAAQVRKTSTEDLTARADISATRALLRRTCNDLVHKLFGFESAETLDATDKVVDAALRGQA